MKFLIALCVLTLVALSSGKPRDKRCIYIEGRCWKKCEKGTFSYNTACGPMTPEATCDNPNPVPGRGAVCDYSACYCASPTVRDTVSRNCVKLEECPKNSKDEKPINKNEKPIDKNEKPIDKNEKPIDKNEKPIEKNEKPIDNKEEPFDLYEKPIERL